MIFGDSRGKIRRSEIWFYFVRVPKVTAQADAYEAVGFKKDNRDFSAAGKILRDLEVASVVMLTGNPGKVATLEGQGVMVVGTKEIE